MLQCRDIDSPRKFFAEFGMFGWFKKKPSLVLDLTKDRVTLMSHMVAGVNEFSRSPKSKNRNPITRIDIRFDLTSEAFPRVWLELDDEPSGEPDTGRTFPLQIFELVCKRWARPCHAALDRKAVSVVTPRGFKIVNSETTLCEAVGPFLVELMKSLRSGGVFKSLRRAEKCYIGVSTNDGEFAWPAPEDRGPENMV